MEKELLDGQNGDLLRDERRRGASGIEVAAPFDARGIALMRYRDESSDGPRATAKNDDTWVDLPSLRCVRRISSAQRTDAVSGADFTLDDLRSFAGIVPEYRSTCLGRMELLAPMNGRGKACPYEKNHNFGPHGLSYADDRWQLRKAVEVRFVPQNDDHPHDHKDIHVDEQTLTPLCSFAYDQKEEL